MTKYATLFLHKRKFDESGLVLPSVFLLKGVLPMGLCTWSGILEIERGYIF
jgi:hypothetical protein